MRLPPSPRVFITGGGSGLGRALAVALAPRGARILVGDVNVERAEETAALVRAGGGSAESLCCDVSKAADLVAAADRMEALWGATDLLVNNAGVAGGGAIGEVSLDDWEWIVRINLWGVIHGCHVFAPRMKARNSGAILNVASSAGIACLPEMGSYNVTKAGVIALSETLHTELAPSGIAVSVLCPTFFRTNLMESFRAPHDRHRRLAEAMFARSRMTAEQVARAALDGLERGRLMIVPQSDGKALYRFKRLAPTLWWWSVKRTQRRVIDRLMKRAGALKPS